LEFQKDRALGEVSELRAELASAVQEKVTILKEMKSYLKDSDFKFNEEISELREIIEEKQKAIEAAKHRQTEEVKKLNEQLYKQEQAHKVEVADFLNQESTFKNDITIFTKALEDRDSNISAQRTDI
jgi:hypothetical protein